MKKQRIKNRIYASILIAILIQSVIFGVMLFSTGIYASITEEPYRILRSQMEEKNRLVSENMNHTLLEGNKLLKQIERLTAEDKIQEKIVESLSRQDSVSGIFYVDFSKDRSIYFVDNEPSVQSADFGDIRCRIGNVQTSEIIALDVLWRKEPNERDLMLMENYLNYSGNKNRWTYFGGALYYVMLSEYQGRNQMLALELERDIIESMLQLDQPAYEGMQVVITEDNSILYGPNCGEGKDILSKEEDVFTVELEEETYVGIRSQLQNYGRIFQEKNLYIGLMCKESAITKLGREVTGRIALAYGLSILIAAVVAYIGLRQVMKPWNQLHEDIKKQDTQKIHFDQTGFAEVDTVYEALNAMTAQLERSYTRHAFAMEVAEEYLGSFEYRYGSDEVTISQSVGHILQIPNEMYFEQNRISVEDWALVNTRLRPVEGMDGYLYRWKEQEERYVTIRTKEEASGIFGVIIDKTEEYRKISKLQYISEHDHLTGLYNGAHFKAEGQKQLDNTGWKRAKQTVQAMMFCDLDNLKTVNDTYGHVAGDCYLRGMADWLRHITEKEDALIARMSGDEFAVLFYGYDNREEILEHIEEAYRLRPVINLQGGNAIELSASIGISFHAGRGGNVEQLLKEADKAMYRQKHSTKNGICIY